MMSSFTTTELLEETHAFPCPFVFKVIGKAHDSFLAQVVAVVREELGIEIDPPYKVREAVGGRHLAVTLEPMVQSAQQVIAIYRRLQVIDGLVMLF
jgi:putative lipoic acid-binding regulatory protein